MELQELSTEYPERIKALRKQLGLTQAELAKALGVTFATVNRWENRKAQPSILAWQQIVAAERFGMAGLAKQDQIVASIVGQITPDYQDKDLDFGASPEAVRALVEGERLAHGHYYSRAFASETAQIQPLPHQRIAVYERMLSQSRLRFLLGDDPGAGKTIMSGLYIREMMSRGLLRRILIIPPAGLLGNWQRELRHLFGLDFRIVEGREAQRTNPFVGSESNNLIISVDTLAGERMFGRLKEEVVEPYELVIFDEAHKLAVREDSRGNEITTQRYELAKALAGVQNDEPRWCLGWSAHHLLLLTATPHMGYDYPYFALWRLLEPEIFQRPQTINRLSAANRTRYFLRRTKEEMVDYEGKPIFPRREPYTLSFSLTPSEKHLYDRVTQYMRVQYNRADGLNRTAVQLAMSVFQRRMASSTYALVRSLERRIEKLDEYIQLVREHKLTIEDLRKRLTLPRKHEDPFDTKTADEDAGDEIVGQEAHEREEAELLASGVVAYSLHDLREERAEVASLLTDARQLLESGEDTKFAALRHYLNEESNRRDKLLIFTEHRDTLTFLIERLHGIGFAGQVTQIHGGMNYAARDEAVEFFRKHTDEGGAAILIGTDAAGEGINLQFCWRMVNYDLPWNPARLEQRMGRVHRYGQKSPVVHILNLVTTDTREGAVLNKLMVKLEAIRSALSRDKVFDVIGQILSGLSVPDCMRRLVLDPDQVEAITQGLESITASDAKSIFDKEAALYGKGEEIERRLPELRAELDRERVQRLLPGFVLRYLHEGLPFADVELTELSDDGQVFKLDAKSPHALDPILPLIESYSPALRNRFTVRRPVGDLNAIWLRPGEPVFETLHGIIRNYTEAEGRRGAVFIDPNAQKPYFLHVGTLEIKRKRDPEVPGLEREILLDQQLAALREDENGNLEDISLERLLLLRGGDGVPVAYRHIVRNARASVRRAESALSDRANARVENLRNERLLSFTEREQLLKAGYDYQMAWLTAQRSELRRQIQPEVRELEKVRKRQQAVVNQRDMALRRLEREIECIEPGHISFIAHALVLPTSDPDERRHFDASIERIAMNEAIAFERTQGREVIDVSTPERAKALGLSDWPGFDLLSRMPDGTERYIEVKGRAGQGGVEITANEWARSCNLARQYWLYVVYGCASERPTLHRMPNPYHQLFDRIHPRIVVDEADVYRFSEL